MKSRWHRSGQCAGSDLRVVAELRPRPSSYCATGPEPNGHCERRPPEQNRRTGSAICPRTARRIPPGDPSDCCLRVDAELSSDVGHVAATEEKGKPRRKQFRLL